MRKKAFPVYDISSLSNLKQEDILISRFAPYLKSHENLRAAHRHSFYHVILFTKGDGEHTIDFQTFPVKPYQIYFMVPGQTHSWQFNGNVDGYVLNFSAQFVQSFLLKPDYLEQFPFFNGSVNDAVINLPGNMHKKITALFEELITESETIKHLSYEMVQTLMLQIFILVGRLSLNRSSSVTSSHNYVLMKDFRKLIEQHFTDLRLPKQYAALLFISPNHLNAVSNSVLGISAGEVIRNRIVLEAKRLLTNQALTVLEIATQLNFADNSYFSRFYKKQTGHTPEEFRKKL